MRTQHRLFSSAVPSFPLYLVDKHTRSATMENKSLNEQIIKKYQDDEKTMIHLFVEWCRQHKFDPHAVYEQAYPAQVQNPVLAEIIEASADQAPLEIPTHTLLEVLQIFGNEELAFVVTELIEKSSKP